MTIASEITRINTNIANAYTACNNKGATMPATQNSANLATTINSISGGSTPTGTLSITANGTYDVTNYASANVSVSGGGVNLLTARYLSTDGFVSLSYNSYCYELTGTGHNIYGEYNTILQGTNSDQIDALLSFMLDIYSLKTEGYESIYDTIVSYDYGLTFVPILLPSLDTIEVYDFDSKNLQWTLTLEN